LRAQRRGRSQKKRIARIWPALILCVLISAFIFSPIFGGGTIDRPQLFSYVLKNIGNVYNQHFVSGVYDDHPDRSLNGSLWSLTLEARLYFVLFLAMLIGLHKTRPQLGILMVCIVAQLVVQPSNLVLLGSDTTLFGAPSFPLNTLLFVAGALFFISGGGGLNYFYIICLALIVFMIAPGMHLKSASFWVFVVSLSLFLSRLPLLHTIKLPGDYSYGVYLYGWPAQQIVYSCAPKLIPELNFIFAAGFALGMAALSWHFLEKPILNKVRRKQ